MGNVKGQAPATGADSNDRRYWFRIDTDRDCDDWRTTKMGVGAPPLFADTAILDAELARRPPGSATTLAT